MTEQEAIEMMQGYQITDVVDRAEYDAFQMAIDALEEIRKYKNIGVSSADELEQDLLLHKADSMVLNEYKAIGAVEDFKNCMDIINKAEQGELAKIIDEWLLYHEIGTVEECREAVERQTPQKVITYKESNIADCPICGAIVRGINKPFGDYCSKCGQKLDWSEEK